MKSLARALLYTLLALFLLTAAFAGGYWLRGETDPALTGGAGSALTAIPDDADAVWNGELFRQVWMLLEQDFYGEDPSLTARTYASVRGLTDSYHDAYTRFLEPQPRELERDQLRGRFGGIGAWIDAVEGGYALRPMPGQPAEAAGVMPGDRLVAIDDTPVSGETSIETITALIRGPVDTEVCLGLVRDPGSESLRICVARAEIETPSVEWRLIEDISGSATVGYLKQSVFSERSADEMKQALGELMAGGATQFVLDLRGNPGGLVSTAVDVASIWLDAGVVFYESKADGSEKSYLAEAGDRTEGAALVVIVDGASASASEIVAGSLQDRGRAVIVGERTYGKGSVQQVHELVDGSSLHVTSAHWFTPNHNAIDGVGLTPDITIEPGTDPVPQALEILAEMSSSGQ
ncbi:MAG: S41 family peptidase [Caldilineaceae bacterium]|nr:S41 family peptidase [Caldilineaceae bacterium]